MNIEQYLGKGIRNGKTREQLRIETGLTDRILRAELHSGDVPVVSFNGLYFIAGKGDEIYTRTYMRAEQAKALRILENVRRLQRQTGVHLDDVDGQILLPIMEGVE